MQHVPIVRNKFIRPNYDMATAQFAMSANQAVNQIFQGQIERAKYGYSANIAQQEAKTLEFQGEFTQGQMARERGRVFGESVAAVSGMGIGLQGSATAAIVGTQRQMLIDAAVEKYNTRTQVGAKKLEASEYRRSGKAAVRSGYFRAFSTILQGGSKYSESKGLFTKSTTFDTNIKLPKLK